jgi:hypothetical protein
MKKTDRKLAWSISIEFLQERKGFYAPSLPLSLSPSLPPFSETISLFPVVIRHKNVCDMYCNIILLIEIIMFGSFSELITQYFLVITVVKYVLQTFIIF